MQSLRIFLVRQQVQQFVTEDQTATWFEHYEWNSAFNLRRHDTQNILEIFPRGSEQSEIIERSPATHVLLWHQHSVPCILQHRDRCLRGLRMKIGVECIRPENNFRAIRI